MILYFDKNGYLVKKDDQNEIWLEGDNNAYSLSAKFYNETYGNITDETSFIDLSNYAVGVVVKREDNAQSPVLVTTRSDKNTTASVIVDNWWTEVKGEIKITVLLRENGKLKAQGIAYHTIGEANTPSDTTITESEKVDIWNALANKEDSYNKVDTIVPLLADNITYPSEKAVVDYVTKEKNEVNEKINSVEGDLESHVNSQNNPHVVTKEQVGLGNVENKTLENSVIYGSKNYITSGAVYEAIKDITGGDYVLNTRKVAGYELRNDITATQLFNALELGTASKKNTGYNADMIPIIGTDGKLPVSIIPIGKGMFYGGSIFYDRNKNIVSPSKEFVSVFGGVELAEFEINLKDDYAPAYFIVSEKGTILGFDCEVGDWIVCNSAYNYVKIDNVDAVISVNGYTGLVKLNTSNIQVEEFILGTDDSDITNTDTINNALSKLQNKNKVNYITLPRYYSTLELAEFQDLLSKLDENKVNVLHYVTENTYIDYLVNDFSNDNSGSPYVIFLDVQATSINVVELEYTELGDSMITNRTEIGASPEDVVIDQPSTATNGTLTQTQLYSLQNDENVKIRFANEIFRLEDKGHTEGYLTYTHNGYDNNSHWQKVITITISTRGWVLNTIEVSSKDYVAEYVEEHSSVVDEKELVKEVNSLDATEDSANVVYYSNNAYSKKNEGPTQTSVTDLTNTTWILNETLPKLSTQTNFAITGTMYSGAAKTNYPIKQITIQKSSIYNTDSVYIWGYSGYYGEHNYYYTNTDYIKSVDGTGTYSPADVLKTSTEGIKCRTITITGGTDATNSTLISYLKTNAKLVVDISYKKLATIDDIPDTSSLITKDTSDLTNYFTKSEVNTKDTTTLTSAKSYTDEKISEISVTTYTAGDGIKIEDGVISVDLENFTGGSF